jgi:hypothetical protein
LRVPGAGEPFHSSFALPGGLVRVLGPVVQIPRLSWQWPRAANLVSGSDLASRAISKASAVAATATVPVPASPTKRACSSEYSFDVRLLLGRVCREILTRSLLAAGYFNAGIVQTVCPFHLFESGPLSVPCKCRFTFGTLFDSPNGRYTRTQAFRAWRSRLALRRDLNVRTPHLEESSTVHRRVPVELGRATPTLKWWASASKWS